jgi:hypothetical protein
VLEFSAARSPPVAAALEFAPAGLCASPALPACGGGPALLFGSAGRARPGGGGGGRDLSASLSPGPTANAQALRELMAIDDVTISFPRKVAAAACTAPAPAPAPAAAAAAAARPAPSPSPAAASAGRQMYTLEDVERIASYQKEALKVDLRRGRVGVMDFGCHDAGVCQGGRVCAGATGGNRQQWWEVGQGGLVFLT